MRIAAASILIIAVLACSPAGTAPLRQDPSALCPPAPPGGKVDAALDEVVWQMPPVVPKFVDSKGQEPKEQTQAWIAYARDGVWFAFSCEQTKMGPANSPASKTVWDDDAVGVLVDVAGERNAYDCFLLNAAGAKMHIRVDGNVEVDWKAGGDWQAAVKLGDGRWTAEIFVPYSVLGVTLKEGSVLRANVCRNNMTDDGITCWIPAKAMLPEPLRFGNLVMGIPSAFMKLTAEAEPRTKDGAVVFRVHCESQATSDMKLAATLYPGGSTLESTGPVTVSAGKTADTVFSAEKTPRGTLNLKVVAVDSKTESPVSEASFIWQARSAPAVGIGATISTQPWGTLWSSISTSKVMRDTPPPATKQAAVRLAAASNEYEAFQIVLRPTRQLTGVKVTPHTLTGPKGRNIEAWNIKARNVEYVDVTSPTSADIEQGQYPDPLPVFAPFTAEAGQNSPVWVSVYVPPKTPPGDYAGTVDIEAAGLNRISVPVKLRVWGFDLPSVSKLRTAFGCGFGGPINYQGATTLEQKRKLLDLYNLEFFRHRIAPYTPYAFHDIKGSVANGEIKLDFTDFDVTVGKYFPLFNSYNLPGFGMGGTAGMDFGDDYDRLKTEYMRAVTEHLADLGQIEKGYNYITDEPNEEQYKAVKDASDLCRRADERIKVLLTEQVEKALVGSVDIWVPLISNYDEQKSKARQATGEQVWWYVCCGPHHPYPNNFIDYPAIDQRILPWITWRYGLNGILYWETTYWRDNPYETAMSYTPDGKSEWGNGDGRLLYPPVKQPSSEFVAKGPVPSIRWEMIRDGIEDYDYIRILQDKLAKTKVKTGRSVDKANAALKLARTCAESRTEFTRDPTKLESARRQVAEAIEGLK